MLCGSWHKFVNIVETFIYLWLDVIKHPELNPKLGYFYSVTCSFVLSSTQYPDEGLKMRKMIS